MTKEKQTDRPVIYFEGTIDHIIDTRTGPQGCLWANGRRHAVPLPDDVVLGDNIRVTIERAN